MNFYFDFHTFQVLLKKRLSWLLKDSIELFRFLVNSLIH